MRPAMLSPAKAVAVGPAVILARVAGLVAVVLTRFSRSLNPCG